MTGASPIERLSPKSQILATLLQTLIQDGKQDVNQVDLQGLTALHHIVKADSVPVARAFLFICKILKAGLNLNSTDPHGYTPVHALITLAGNAWATPENVEMLQVLVNAGADINKTDLQGLTPLFYAAQEASGRMYHALLDVAGSKLLSSDEKPTLRGVELPLEVIMPDPVPLNEDADRVYKSIEEEIAKASDIGKHGPPIDPLSGLKDVASILYEEETSGGVIGGGAAKESAPDSSRAASTPSQNTTTIDHGGKVYYDVTLSRIDSGYGYNGQHMFYRCTALHNHVQGLFILWTRWGMVGEDGQYQRTPYRTREECITEFCKVFKSKTGFSWSERATSQPKEGKYKLQPPGGRTVAELQFERLRRLSPRMFPDWPAIPKNLQFLLRILTDTQMLAENMVRDRPFQLPFGAAQQSSIKEAVKVLDEAHAILGKLAELNDRATKISSASAALANATLPHALTSSSTTTAVVAAPIEHMEADGLAEGNSANQNRHVSADDVVAPPSLSITAQMDSISSDRQSLLHTLKKLSERFFELVPAKRRTVGTLMSTQAVDEALNDLSILEQQNVAAKLIIAAHSNQERLNPFEYILRACNAVITPLPHSVGGAFEILKEYATPSNKSMEVVDIFQVERRGEASRFLPFATLSNRMLLFHGTCAANVFGILNEGLCCAPPSATIHGHAYGKGVYFADVISKSLAYASNNGGNPNTNNHATVFVAEVYLGKVDQGGSRPRDRYDSVLIQNGPASFSSVIETKTGARIPLGAKCKLYVCIIYIHTYIYIYILLYLFYEYVYIIYILFCMFYI